MNYLDRFECDCFPTPLGDLTIWFIGHGTLLIEFQDHRIHVDPFSRVADYSRMPQADLILVTHEHHDHLDPGALAYIRQRKPPVIVSHSCLREVTNATVLRNGESVMLLGVNIQAVPAYNMTNQRPDGQPFHPKGVGNGYVLTFGGPQTDFKIYIAGDTEDIPEMSDLPAVDIAFLPMNLPYTMTPEMVANAARTIHPKILYPYHYGQTDTSLLVALLAGEPGIDVRLRQLA